MPNEVMERPEVELVQREAKTLTYNSPLAEAMLAAAEAGLAAVQGIEIDAPELYEEYGQELARITGTIKSLNAVREELKRPFLVGGREIDDKFREPLAKWEQAKSTVNAALTAWRTEQKRIADAEQARLDREARERREAAEREAQALAAAGKAEEAQIVAAQAAVIAAPTVAVNVPKVAGVSGRTTWKGRIVSVPDLLRHIADHPECHEWIEFKQAPIDALARTYKDKLTLPGVVAEEVQSTTARSR